MDCFTKIVFSSKGEPMSKDKSVSETELSDAAWVRSLILKNHALSLEQLQTEHEKSDRKSPVPKDKQVIYLQKSGLCKRWGVKTVDEFPVNTAGGVNLSGMVRLFIKLHGVETPHSKAAKFFAVDGLFLSEALYHNARINFRKKLSPDDNQFAGPRDGKPEPKPEPKVTNKNVTDMEVLMETKKFVQKIGGIEAARKLLGFLEQLQK